MGERFRDLISRLYNAFDCLYFYDISLFQRNTRQIHTFCHARNKYS